MAPGQRHIINPITGQLELVDDDITPPKIDALHESKGHLLSPKGKGKVPSYSRSPSHDQFGKQSPVILNDKVVPKIVRSSPPLVSVKNDSRDPNTLSTTHCDREVLSKKTKALSHKAGEAPVFMQQPSTCIVSSVLQSIQSKPTVTGQSRFSNTSIADTQTISAILSNVSKSGNLALATLNPHNTSLNVGTPMQTSGGEHVVSTVPFTLHGSSSVLVNTTAVSKINPSDFISFPHKDSSSEVRHSQIPSVLMEADSSGDSNNSVPSQSGFTSETPASSSLSSFGLHGIKQTPSHASHTDIAGSGLSQVQGAIHVNSVEGPILNSVHVNSNVRSPPVVNRSTPQGVSIQPPFKTIASNTSNLGAPTVTSKPNGTTRFMHQVQNKQSGELLNHDSELSSHSSDDHVKQGSIDSGLGLGDMKTNSGESPSGSSGNDSPGVTSSSGNRDSDIEKDRDFSLHEKQNVITIGYVLSREDNLHSKSDLLNHLDKYNRNNMDPLKKEDFLTDWQSLWMI